MGKRFTDTQKWKRPWFRALSPHAKVLWQYLCDECDHAGIFLADFDLVSFQVGFKVDEGKLKEWLGDKLIKIDADKYFIPSYFEFQYGDAKEGFKAKQSAIKILKAWNLLDESDSLRDLSNSTLRVQELSKDCHIIIKGKINTKGGMGENASFDEFYSAYVRHEKKKDARKRYEALIAAGTDHEQIMRGLANYKADLARKKTKPEFYKLPTTFLGELPDNWIDQSATAITQVRQTNYAELARELWPAVDQPQAYSAPPWFVKLGLKLSDFEGLHRDEFRPHGSVPALLKQAAEKLGAA